MTTFYLVLTLALLPTGKEYVYRQYDSVQAACEAAELSLEGVIAQVQMDSDANSIKQCCEKRGVWQSACGLDPYTYDCDFAAPRTTKTLRCKLSPAPKAYTAAEVK